MSPDNPDHELARMMSEGRSFSARERNVCLLNAAGGPGEGRRFADISALTGLDYKDDGRAVALVDWERVVCVLCQRRFNSAETLQRHVSFSKLHQENLAARAATAVTDVG